MYKRYNQGWIKHIDFILWDVLSLQIAFTIAYYIRHGGIPYTSEIYRNLAIMLVTVDILISAIFNTMHNVLRRNRYNEAVQTIKQVLMVLVIITLYMFSLQSGDAYSRITVFLTAVFHFIFGYGIRIIWKRVIRRIGKNSLKAAMVLVAEEEQVPKILKKVRSTDDVIYTGIVLSNRDGTGEKIKGVPVVANLETAADYICREWVDEVFVYPAHLTDMEVHRSEIYKSVEGFISDAYGDIAKKEYDSTGDDGDETISTVADLIEACRQMSVCLQVLLFKRM